MNFQQQIISALQEKLDIIQAFPVVFTMSPQTLEMFAASLFTRLTNKIESAMHEGGSELVQENDALGLALLLIRHGVSLPPEMLLDICRAIIHKSRNTAEWIVPTGPGIPGKQGGLWYCKMYLDLSQHETQE